MGQAPYQAFGFDAGTGSLTCRGHVLPAPWHVDSTHSVPSFFEAGAETMKNVTHAHHMDASTLHSDEGRGQLR